MACCIKVCSLRRDRKESAKKSLNEKVNDRDRITKYHGFTIKMQYALEEKMRCFPCRRSWKMTLRKERNVKLKIEKLSNKHRTLQSLNCNYKRREERLRCKISKLCNKIAYLKDECNRCNKKVMETSN